MTDSLVPSVEARKPSGRRPKGFAWMTPEARRELAKLGGGSVPAEKRAFSRDRALAARAGRKGGQARRAP